MLKFLGADDIAMAIAMLLGIGVYICFIGEVPYGLGRHISSLTLNQIEHFQMWSFYQNIISLAATAFAKASICLLLIRLVKHRGYVYLLWALLGMLNIGIHDYACSC